jgi:uncharacterized protein YkwD
MLARRSRYGLALAVLAATLAVPAPASATGIVVATELETQVVARVNAVRQSKGLSRLAVRARLTNGARDHATNMAQHGYFSHSWSNGASFSRWMSRYWPGPGYRFWSSGENLLWSSPAPTAAEVVKAWMDSPGHRANLLNRSWRAIGVGAVWTDAPFGAYAGMPDTTIVAAEFGYRRR